MCICRMGKVERDMLKRLRVPTASLQLPSVEQVVDNQGQSLQLPAAEGADLIERKDQLVDPLEGNVITALREEIGHITSVVSHLELTLERLVVVAMTNKSYLEGNENLLDVNEIPDDITFDETGGSLPGRISQIEGVLENVLDAIRKDTALQIAAMVEATNARLKDQELKNEQMMARLMLASDQRAEQLAVTNEEIMAAHMKALDEWGDIMTERLREKSTK